MDNIMKILQGELAKEKYFASLFDDNKEGNRVREIENAIAELLTTQAKLDEQEKRIDELTTKALLLVDERNSAELKNMLTQSTYQENLSKKQAEIDTTQAN